MNEILKILLAMLIGFGIGIWLMYWIAVFNKFKLKDKKELK